ncbi:MAG: 4-hydroxythreonine-4-phosphate dehydrogenase PdxA [Steroidobacteraceae bacterium]
MPGRSPLRPRLALTSGEPAGIGPDLCIALAQRVAREDIGCDVHCLIDRDLLEARAHELRMTLPAADTRFRVEHVPLAAPAVTGRLDARNGRYVLHLLDRAIDGCRSGEFQGMVTAPVQKSIINDAGIPFSGHTEYLADACSIARPVMLLACEAMKVALVTTHLPVSSVSAAITPAALDETLQIVAHDLRELFGIASPRIAVCGLNPHAGEGGHLGREDGDVIAPAIARARNAGILCTGPLPADTAFLPRVLEQHDVVLAMYHDQGLPVLKYAGFGRAINVTLGLPFLRTSVDHGTALDLAGTGRADAGSLDEALQLAARIAVRRAH